MYLECRQLKMCFELFVIALYVRGVLCMSVESNCYCVLPQMGVVLTVMAMDYVYYVRYL